MLSITRRRAAFLFTRARNKARGLGNWEPALYTLCAALAVILVASWFYGSIRLQTSYAAAWAQPNNFEHIAEQAPHWSAPLDDVFIHFDFARALARGFPFQWSEGNGYSSGGTSLLYPFILAVGYLIGLTSLELMQWAGMVAMVGVFALLLASRRMFTSLPRWTSYLALPAVLGVGALSWTLFSGMEVAFFMALWGGALIAWDDLWRALEQGGPWRILAVILGVWCALLAATRPEAVTSVAIFCISVSLLCWRQLGARAAILCLAIGAVPGALVTVTHAVTNFIFTGETTAAGALAKLEMHHPYLTSEQVWDAWVFHLKYQILRVTHYHFSSVPALGWIVWLFAVLALVSRSTRRYAVVLWLSGLAWVLLVALNGQVRWQNERYTMPAIVWLLLAAALGLGATLTKRLQTPPRLRISSLAQAHIVAVSLGLVAVFAWFQMPRYRDQVWFFGRASRNILDQHVQAAHKVRELEPQRVLVGDAGAIPYIADLPALDIIGLGGYHDLPFAQATRHSVAAAIELIERIPADDRPDLLALYPSWWGSFPMWFGKRIDEFPVRGNVICGGASKVLYAADWSPLADSPHMHEPPAGRIVDALDVADLVSEKQHRYKLSRERGVGHVVMKLLPHTPERRSDVWDAGRVVAPHLYERFTLTGFDKNRTAKLVFRLTASQPTQFGVSVNGKHIETLKLNPADHWQEVTVMVPASHIASQLDVELHSKKTARALYHVWGLQER